MHKYRVRGNEKLTPTTLLLTLVAEDQRSDSFTFEPGQYAAISFKRHGRPTPARCFSIVSSPTERNVLQFSMRTFGRYTKALAQLSDGDEVSVRGPFGGFVINDAKDNNVVLLAGGIGITPFMSMIRHAVATNSSRNITLIFSSKGQDDLPFVKEIMNLASSYPNFKPFFAISDGPIDKLIGQNVTSGRISGDVIDTAVDGAYANTTFFICGPQPFMRGMSKILQDKGVKHDKIMTEAFSQGPNNQTGKIRSWPFNVYILSALGVGLSSFVVMVSDLLKTLPPASLLSTSNNVKLEKLTNSRQADLDTLVNALPEVTNPNPASNATATALSQASSATSPTVTPTTSTTSPAPVTTPAPAPKPVPQPKTCTTSSTGKVTCI